MKIYTGTGDDGTTSLVGGQRVSKTDIRLEAYGSVDELNSYLGLLSTYITDESDKAGIRWIQNRLFCAGGLLATDTEHTKVPESCHISADDIARLEQMIDNAGCNLPCQKAFILPGGSRGSSVCHVARTVCRRSERNILKLNELHPTDSHLLVFMNRLSDYLFVMSRRINYLAGEKEFFWGE